MSRRLTENVIVRTANGKIEGELYVGAAGLPELAVIVTPNGGTELYGPADIPACWLLMPPQGGQVGVLLTAWREIQVAQTAIAQAQREAEGEADVDA